MDVRLPDGRILRGVPEGTTKEQIASKLGLSMDGNPLSSPASPAQTPAVAPVEPVQSSMSSQSPLTTEPPTLKSKLESQRQVTGKQKGRISDMVGSGQISPFEGKIHSGVESLMGLGNQALTAAMHPISKLPMRGPGFEKSTVGERTSERMGQVMGAAGKLPMRGPGMEKSTVGEQLPRMAGEFAEEHPVATRRGRTALGLAETAGAGKVLKAPVAAAAKSGVDVTKKAGAGLVNKADDIIARAKADPEKYIRVLERESHGLFESAKQSGSTLNLPSTNAMIDSIDLKYKPDAQMAKVQPQLSEASGIIDNLRGQPMGVELARATDLDLGARAKTAFKNGRADEGIKIKNMQLDLRREILDMPEEAFDGSPQGFHDWQQAMKVWHQKAKADDVMEIVESAQEMAKSNPRSAAKMVERKARKLAEHARNNKKAYTPEELSWIEGLYAKDKLDTLSEVGGSGIWKYIAMVKSGPFGAIPVAIAEGAIKKGAAKKAISQAKVVTEKIAKSKAEPTIPSKARQLTSLKKKRAKPLNSRHTRVVWLACAFILTFT